MARKNLITASFIIGLVLTVQCVQFGDEAPRVENTSSQIPAVEGRQSARHLFDFVGLGTGNHVDPFLRKTNEKCLNGELSECFKSQALNTFDDLFKRDVYE